MMRAVGLIPSDTGAAGGQRSRPESQPLHREGRQLSKRCAELFEGRLNALYVELWSEGDADEAQEEIREQDALHCPTCGTNAWAKPEARR